MAFPAHVHDRARAFVRSVPWQVAAEVEVVGLLLDYEQLDGRLPFFVMWTGTIPSGADGAGPRPRLDGRFRWDKVPLEGGLAIEIGESGSDPLGAQLRREWIEQDLGAWYEEQDGAGSAARDQAIRERILDLAVWVAAGLHAFGLIERVFGRPVPVFIDSFEDDDPIVELNRRANPPQLHPLLDRLAQRG